MTRDRIRTLWLPLMMAMLLAGVAVFTVEGQGRQGGGSTAITEPFVGVTTNGTPVSGLFPV